MRLLAVAIESLVVLFGGLPPKHKRPSALFEDLKCIDGKIQFSSAKLTLWFEDIDCRLWRAKGNATRIRYIDGKRLIVPYKDGNITIDAIFLREDGKEYMAVCVHRGKECNYSISELRRFVQIYSTDSRDERARRRVFPGIPKSNH